MENNTTEHRTYRWYCSHSLNEAILDREVWTDEDLPTPGYTRMFGETSPDYKRTALEPLGILDLVPTVENIRPLLEEFSAWWTKVEVSWTHYESERLKGTPSHLITLHWVLNDVFKDPTLDPNILREGIKAHDKFLISIVHNRNVPQDIIDDLISRSGDKNDPTRKTNGGEIVCFILQNKRLSAKNVDACVRRARRATTQKDVLYHPNLSRETLVYLSKEGRSETVKRKALASLVARGWLTVE